MKRAKEELHFTDEWLIQYLISSFLIRAAHRTVLRLQPHFYEFSCYPYCKVVLKKLDGTVRVKKRVYGHIYGFLRRQNK